MAIIPFLCTAPPITQTHTLQRSRAAMKDHGRDIGQSEHVRLIGRPRSPYTHRVDDTGYDTSAPLYSTIPSWSFALKYPVFCYTSIGTAVIGRIDSHWPWLNCVIGGSGHGGCARFPSKGWFGFHSLNQFVFIIVPGFNTGSKQTTGFGRTWNNNGQPAKTHFQKIKHKNNPVDATSSVEK